MNMYVKDNMMFDQISDDFHRINLYNSQRKPLRTFSHILSVSLHKVMPVSTSSHILDDTVILKILLSVNPTPSEEIFVLLCLLQY